MKRRRYPHLTPPAVAVLREPVPDAAKRRTLSRAERRAKKEKQLGMFAGQEEGRWTTFAITVS